MWKPETNNKTLHKRLPHWRDSRKKHNIQGEIRTLLGKDCEVKKLMRFLRKIGMLVKI